MAITPPPSLTPPGSQPTRADPASFALRADAYHSWLPISWSDMTAALAWVYARAQDVFTWASAAQADRLICAAAASNPAVVNAAANGAAAQAAATAAAISASLAQATNPDSPIRINPRRITADFTIGSNYNAASVGPIAISDGTTVTVSDNATWSIH